MFCSHLRASPSSLKSLTPVRNIASFTSCCLGHNKTSYEVTEKNLINRFPAKVQPYLRLTRFDRPIGYWLLFWPCSWSISLAANAGEFPSVGMLLTFGVGSVVMRGAGCTINDVWDKDFDKEVSRTASRPIASDSITRPQALVFLAGQLSAGLAILLSLNPYSIALGVASVPLVIIYPLMKRFINWPQAVLGVTFNWGALLGYSAIKGYCDWSICLPLYAASVSWTLLYDTIYGYQDKVDDMKLGLKSTSILFGDSPKKWLSFFATSTILSLLLTGMQSSMSWPYYAGIMAVASHFTWQIASLNIKDPKDCLNKFRSNTNIGIILFLSIMASVLIKS